MAVFERALSISVSGSYFTYPLCLLSIQLSLSLINNFIDSLEDTQIKVNFILLRCLKSFFFIHRFGWPFPTVLFSVASMASHIFRLLLVIILFVQMLLRLCSDHITESSLYFFCLSFILKEIIFDFMASM